VLPQGTTDNLMDYNGGTALYKYQWDYIHDPQTMLFAWAEEEEEGAMKKLKGTYTIWVGESIMTEKKIFINTNKNNKIYVKYEPVAGDTGKFINAKVIYRPVWSKNDISWPVTTWGKINVNTKTYFDLDSLPEGKYMVLLKNKDNLVDTVNFYLRNKKYDFACEVCGRDLSLTLAKLNLIFPGNKNLTQAHVDYLNDALKKAGFTTCKRHAHFFSQVAIESKNFTDFEEDYWYRLLRIYEVFGNQSNDSYKILYNQDFWDKNEHLDYTSSSLCSHLYQKKESCSEIKDKTKRYIGIGQITKTRKGYTITFPESFKKDTLGTYVKYTMEDDEKCGENLFNLVYKDINGNTQEGDGWKYRGRGAIQVTGRENYKKVSDKANRIFNKSYDWENNPDELKEKPDAIIYSAVAWFLNAFNPISTLDNKTSNQVTTIVNKKGEKAAERANKFNELMNDGQLYNCK
jgi:predicted chitinase